MPLSAQPNFKFHFTDLLRPALTEIAPLGSDTDIEFARPKHASQGDYSCNLAMQLARRLHKNPRDIAVLLINTLSVSPYLEKIEIAGAGFINLFLKVSVKQQFLGYVLESG